MFFDAPPSPLQLLEHSELVGMPIWIKRDDLLHPIVSGNKFRKLKYPLLRIAQQLDSPSPPTLVTMGGMWSNHLHATAFAAQAFGYQSIGLIRGDSGVNSATLDDCRCQGMELQFVDRASYRRLRAEPLYWQQLLPDFSHRPQQFHWLPEGGSDPDALRGVAEIVDELELQQPKLPDVIMVACGTAATLAGLLAGLKGRSTVVGVAVLKNADYLRGEVTRLLRHAGYPDYQNYQLLTDFHHGGYAKSSFALQQFCLQFCEQSAIMIEPVYTGKVFYALRELVKSGYFAPQTSITVIHTGGLQGARGSLRI